MTQPGAFIWLPQQGELAVPALRFAIADRARRTVSGAWAVRVDRHGVFRIAGAGSFGLITLAIRRRGLAFSHAVDGGAMIVGRQIAPPGPRATRWVPAPDHAPWHACSLSFPFEFLRRTAQPPADPARRPAILLPESERGRMYRVAFLVTDSLSGRVDYEDRSDLYLGRATDGRSRSLLVMGRVVDSDLAMLSDRLSRLSPQAPLRLHSRTGAPPDEECGLLLLEPGADHLDMVELHNLHRAAPAGPTRPVAAPQQLRLDLG